MIKSFFVIIFICLSNIISAQDTSLKEVQAVAGKAVNSDTSKEADINGWIKGLAVALNVTQVGNSNWIAAGPDDFSLSLPASFNAFASRKWGRNTWDNMLDINYGLVNTTSLGVRKLNDRIDLVSKYGYATKKWKTLNLSLLGQFRSQLTSGYQYDYLGTTQKRRNSGLFAPAYIIIAPGIDWKPKSWLSLFVSPASLRWTIVSNAPYSYLAQGGVFNGQQETALATLYGVNPGKEHRGEAGAFLTAVAKRNIVKNVAYYGKLDLYSNYLKNAKNMDVFFTNQFRFNIYKWLGVSYSLDLLYDDDVKNPRQPSRVLGLQVLSTFGVGFATKF